MIVGCIRLLRNILESAKFISGRVKAQEGIPLPARRRLFCARHQSIKYGE